MVLSRRPFIITIDTEGDNLWARPQAHETSNARFVARFQALCERYGLKPTYLVNYEMAICPAFVELARDVLRRGTGEVGMHLHAWNSPPIRPLTVDDNLHHPYLTEFPLPVMAEKVAFMTDLLEDTFQIKMTSHRAGRWAFNGAYARVLVDHGYQVDCSVTPHLSWRRYKGVPDGLGGSDYRRCPKEPYFVDLQDPRRPGASPLLEVPMSTVQRGGRLGLWLNRHVDDRVLVWRAMRRVFPPLRSRMLVPDGRNRADLLRILADIEHRGGTYAEFMLHSSELMPGGSPTFGDEPSIERLYDDLEYLFDFVCGRFEGVSLTEFRNRWTAGRTHHEPGLADLAEPEWTGGRQTTGLSPGRPVGHESVGV
jgi:hypothetical protein